MCARVQSQADQRLQLMIEKTGLVVINLNT